MIHREEHCTYTHARMVASPATIGVAPPHAAAAMATQARVLAATATSPTRMQATRVHVVVAAASSPWPGQRSPTSPLIPEALRRSPGRDCRPQPRGRDPDLVHALLCARSVSLPFLPWQRHGSSRHSSACPHSPPKRQRRWPR